MNTVIGFIFIGLILLVFLRWVLGMGKLGFMMIGITLCVPAAMGCVLNLKGQLRLWAILPAVLIVVLSVLIFREWNGVMKA